MRLIDESEALRRAGDLARVAPSEYGRLKRVLASCPTVNTEGVPLDREPIDKRIKRAVGEQLAAFKLPDGVRPKSVRLMVEYDGLLASVTVEIPEEVTEANGEKR